MNLDRFLAAMDEADDSDVASIAASAIAILTDRGTDAWTVFGRAFRSRLSDGDREEARAQFDDATAP